MPKQSFREKLVDIMHEFLQSTYNEPIIFSKVKDDEIYQKYPVIKKAEDYHVQLHKKKLFMDDDEVLYDYRRWWKTFRRCPKKMIDQNKVHVTEAEYKFYQFYDTMPLNGQPCVRVGIKPYTIKD